MAESGQRQAEVAERVGFEPTDPRGSTVFKTVAIDHSATSPISAILTVCRCRRQLQALGYRVKPGSALGSAFSGGFRLIGDGQDP